MAINTLISTGTRAQGSMLVEESLMQFRDAQ